MEDRGWLYFVLMLLICASFGGFAYSVGWRQGEASARADPEFRQQLRSLPPVGPWQAMSSEGRAASYDGGWDPEPDAPVEPVCPPPSASPAEKAKPVADLR